MDWGNVISVVVAAFAAAAAIASQRSASRASTMNTQTTSRVDMEKEAYDRARKFDIETIERQDAEILELRQLLEAAEEKIAVARAEARAARSEVRQMRIEKDDLRERIRVLEDEIHMKGPHR